MQIMVGFPPRGVTDLYARLIGQWLSDRLGQPFVVENQPGASNNIATESYRFQSLLKRGVCGNLVPLESEIL